MQVENSLALNNFEQKIDTKDFEHWVLEGIKNPLYDCIYPEIHYGIGENSNEYFLCVSYLPYTVEAADLQRCFCRIPCAVKLYEKEGFDEREEIRDRCYEIIARKLRSMKVDFDRQKTGYLLETIRITGSRKNT